MAVKIVMGVSCSGKTKFIKEHFPNWSHHSIGEIQRRLRKEEFPMVGIEMLIKANEQIKELVVRDLQVGRDVVMEHTLFKAKRRIGYVEEFKKYTDEPIDIYLLYPTEEELKANVEAAPNLNENDIPYLLREMKEIEIPNIAEGYGHIYIVTNGVVTEHISDRDETIIHQAEKELKAEEEQFRKKKEAKKQKEAFFDKMEEEGFWHYCEVCGKKEKLSSKQAFDEGWDYPGKNGIYKDLMPNYGFGAISPRTCGNCGIMDTTYMKLTKGQVKMGELEGREKETIERILSEPGSLLCEEK